MAVQKIALTTPVGRLVSGSVYKGRTQNAEGAPLVYKSGPEAGKPRQEFYVAIALPKGAEKHWAETEWGSKIWQAGHAGMPSAGQNPKFAWKVTDGDSQVPNGKGNKPCDREGWPGNWVLHFSSSYPMQVYNRDGSQKLTEVDAIRLGYYVQIAGDVAFNGSAQQPGIYLNGGMIALSAFGEEIYIGPDASQAGFGAAPLPAGASLTPPAGFAPPAAAGVPAPAPTMPAPPAAAPAPAPAPAPHVAPPAAAPAPVAPNPAFTAVPPPAVPAAPARQMTAKAAGATYESFIAQGWNDSLLVEHGYMLS